MTRINTIDVEHLTDQHLMAEYREMPMVNASLKRSLNSKKGFNYENIPSKYTLNKGHVTFFYNKGKWLYNRYQKLVGELKKRGYNVDPNSRNVDWSVFQGDLYGDWQPTTRDHRILVERIVQRVLAKHSWYRYYSNPINNNYLTQIVERYCE